MASEGKPELHASSSGDQRTLDRLEYDSRPIGVQMVMRNYAGFLK